MNLPAETPLPRVTILTAESGGGHRTAAQSLAEAMEGRARVSFLNLMDEHAPFPINTWSEIYGPWVTYAPRLYHLVYRLGTDRRRVLQVARLLFPYVKAAITPPLLAQETDLFISVHPLQIDVPLWILRSAGRRVPFVTVVTDPVTPPVAWFCPDVDLCVVATERAREVALACGVPPHKVQVIGLPIRRSFTEALSLSRREARERLGLANDRPLLLVTGGGAGIGRLMLIARALARRLATHPAPPYLAIIAGRNRVLARRLRNERWPLPVQVLGFVNNMAEWMAAADLLVTKAGPGTLAEAACLGLPALISGFIPGQETGNVEWVQQHGAAIYEPNPEKLAHLADELLRPGNPLLAQMAARARSLGRPYASAEIAEAALRLIRAPEPA